MTGSQVMHFTLHSHAVIDPVLTPAMRAHPAWLSWLKHVELFSLAIKHELNVSDVTRLDDLQLEYTQLFELVPEYEGLFRPKASLPRAPGAGRVAVRAAPGILVLRV